MRAAEPDDKEGEAEVVPIDRSARKHPDAPVYAHRDVEATGTFDVEVDVRGWTRQAVQWLVIFAILGAIIGGAKWWSARQGAEIARLATAPAVSPPAPQAADDDGSAPGEPSGTSAASSEAGAPSGSLAGSGTLGTTPPVTDPAFAETPDGSQQVAPAVAETPVGTTDAPTVRAPSEVPYPARIHDVAPQVPEGATVQRGIAVLSLLIDTAGNVAEVELLRGLDPVLDDAAVAAAWQWKFEPTDRNGRAVAVRSNFTVRFGY